MTATAGLDDVTCAEILRRASVALSGRPVVMWEGDDAGHLHAVASDQGMDPMESAPSDLERVVRRWHRERKDGPRWLATRSPFGGWCGAHIRVHPWGPPPTTERRGRDRIALEFVGLCLGLLEATPPGDRRTIVRATADRRRSALARLVAQLPVALWTTDSELHITSHTGAAGVLSGVIPAAEPGASLIEISQAGQIDIDVVRSHRRALAGESLSHHIRQNGRWLDAMLQPIHGDDGRIIGVVGVAIDVTAHERALDEARQHREDLEDFIENAPVGVHWAAPDGTILKVNQAELDMLGYTRQEYVGRDVAEFYVNPEAAEAYLTRLREGETLRNVELQLRHKDGSVRYALLSSNGKFHGGQLVHTRCITRDVTDRWQASMSQARLSAIVNSADDAILAKTLDGVITDWNPAAERIYGYSAEEIVGQNVGVLIPPGQPNELAGIMERLRRGERVMPYETDRRHKDGRALRMSVTVSPILDEAGQPIGASAIARPVGPTPSGALVSGRLGRRAGRG